MTINIKNGLEFAGRIECKVSDFKEEDVNDVAIKILNEILSITQEKDFEITIDVFRQIYTGEGA